jgi:hypothetical protein
MDKICLRANLHIMVFNDHCPIELLDFRFNAENKFDNGSSCSKNNLIKSLNYFFIL